MPKNRIIDHFRVLTNQPTAPFREQWVGRALDTLLARIDGLRMTTDRYGNRIVRLVKGNPAGPAPTFVVHLDHPGFLFPRATGAVESMEKNVFRATFEGRVMHHFFPGAGVRLFRSADDDGVPGEIISVDPVDAQNDNQKVMIAANSNAAGAVLGMWDLPPMEWDGTYLSGRACDDLAGVAVVVESLMRLSKEKNVDASAVFTCAEEAGFCGALCMLHDEGGLPDLLPPDPEFVSVEISGELPSIQLGGGTVVRVGDRTSIFERELTDNLWNLGRRCQIMVRRALMDLGTCEATAFVRSGYRAGGICAPVRHYHNMDQTLGVIASEIVHSTDLEAMTELIVAVSRELSIAPSQIVAATAAEYRKYLEKGRAELLASDAPDSSEGVYATGTATP